ncbi:hypothetical protein PCANC_24260 [Puccinia coronata f. sp. avenae]|uniref:AMP-dependent synthetase/ligase domain-containing protein n=1 Tax=Puccinia coronata f. sp. avenae TaxID=200324 RepID=A0A2N5S307_9BASI|nr:hypothetical protein PCANC_24260 [Puccinia coronata f. sp. avenae]
MCLDVEPQLRGPTRTRWTYSSPAMAAAAAIHGRFTDVRNIQTTTRVHQPKAVGKAAGSPKFEVWRGISSVLEASNVDTDNVIPAVFLKTIKRTGLGQALFRSLRYRLPFNQAKILIVTGPNFGCGSSREHAPWALLDFGVTCVIATRMLPLILPQKEVDQLARLASEGNEVEVDLVNQQVRAADFVSPPWRMANNWSLDPVDWDHGNFGAKFVFSGGNQYMGWCCWTERTHPAHLPKFSGGAITLSVEVMLPPPRGRRSRRGYCMRRFERYRQNALAPHVASGSTTAALENNEEDLRDGDSNSDTEATSDPNDGTHFYFVPRYRQEDPEPGEPITTPETLAARYKRSSFGRVVIAPRGGESFCKASWIPFDTMSPEETLGWQKLVCYLIERTHYVNEVEVNGSLLGGCMWADGWRKSTTRAESFGRYCSVTKLVLLMSLAQYNQQDEAAAAREATEFIAKSLMLVSPGVFEAYRKILIDNNLPAMAHMEYPTPYNTFDFASFLTFTMYDFYNAPHKDSDKNFWTLVIWIPIFNPLTSKDDDPILADVGFDMVGGSSPCIGTRLTWDCSSQPVQPRPDYQWLSYAQVLAKIRDLSAGFVELLRPSHTLPSPSSSSAAPPDGEVVLDRPRLALWCPSSPSWTISEYAAYRNSITVVSINDHLPAQTASAIIHDTHPRAIILSTHNFNRLATFRVHQRRYQITNSRADSSDLQSSRADSLHSDIDKLSLKSRKKTAPNEPPRATLSDSGRPTAPHRDQSLASPLSDASPCTSSLLAHPSPIRLSAFPEPIYIIIDPLQLSSHTRLDALHLGLTFYSLEEVARIGHSHILSSLPVDAPDLTLEPQKVIQAEKLNHLRPGSRTVAGIVYSSGTTGNPKPCVLTHGNFAANLAAFNRLVEQGQLQNLHTQELVQFSYLPLHHIYEKMTQAWVLNQGGSIGFSSLESLRILEDISVLEPTFLATTPSFLTHQILDRRLQFLDHFSSFKSPIETYLLNKAIEQKLKMLKAGFGEHIWLWDRFVLGYLCDQLGGRLKWIISGTSPLSKHVAELLSVSLSVKISEGYGLTETCGAACFTVEDGSNTFVVGHVGPPLPCCEVKLEKVEGLVPTQDSPFEEGRVYMRGPNVFAGYLVPRTAASEERIESAVDAEGWLATGDIGYMDDSGRLHLVDRLLTTVEGRGRSGTLLGQQIHNQFNLVDLDKIQQRLLAAVPEVAQMFVSGRVAKTHAEVGIGQVGDLIGFVVVHTRAFVRWIAHHHLLPNPNNQVLLRPPDLEHDDNDNDGGGHRWLSLFSAGEEWEIVQQLQPGVTHPSLVPQHAISDNHISDNFHPPLPSIPSTRSRPSSRSESECPIDLDAMCKDPQVTKCFLNYLTQKGQSAGLKLYEMPKTLYMSTKEFKAAGHDDDNEQDSLSGMDSKGKSVDTEHAVDPPPSTTHHLSSHSNIHHHHHHVHPLFISLHSKNSQLLRHFS